MPFVFSQKLPISAGQVSTLPVSTGEYLASSFEQGVHDSMFSSIMNLREMSLADEGPWLTADEANSKYGLPTLTFDKSIRESQAEILNHRKSNELTRSLYLEEGNHDGLFSVKGGAGLAAGFLGSVLNPLDLSVNFLPIVGSEVQAAKLARLGSFRQGLARGVITEEALAMSVPAIPRLTAAFIEGGVGNFVAEIPHLASALQSQENYTVEDSALNLVFGTAFGGVLYLGINGAVKIYDKLHPVTKERMLRDAMDSVARDEPIGATKWVYVDEATIREKVKFNDNVERERILSSIDPDVIKKAVKEQFGEEVDKSAYRNPVTGEVRTGEAHLTIDIEDWADVTPERGFTTDKGRFISPEEMGDMIGLPKGEAGVSEHLTGELPDERLSSDPAWLLPDDRNFFDLLKEQGATDAQAMKQTRQMIAGRKDARFFARPDIQAKVDELTKLETEKLLQETRDKYDEQGAFEQVKKAEIAKQVAQGKILTESQKKNWNFSKKETEEITATLTEQISELEAELKSLEEPTSLEEVDSAKEKAKLAMASEKSAMEQALDCLLKNPV